MEDAAADIEFGPIGEKLESTVLPLLGLLTNEDLLKGAGVFASRARKWLENELEIASGDINIIREKKAKLKEEFSAVAKALFSVGPFAKAIASTVLSDTLSKSGRQYGLAVGKSMNSFATFVNMINEKDPQVIPDFLSGVFEGIDSEEAGKATDTLVQNILDQKPPVVRWTTRIMASRIKKRLIGK